MDLYGQLTVTKPRQPGHVSVSASVDINRNIVSKDHKHKIVHGVLLLF